MLSKSLSESVVAELFAGNIRAVRQQVDGFRQRGQRREIEALRFLLWWLRSYLQASRIRPDLGRRKLEARNCVLEVVEVCIIRYLGDTLPAPGLSWTPEQRDGERRKRAVASVHLADSRRNPPVDNAPSRDNRFSPQDLEELRAEILAAWEREQGRYGGGPLTAGLVRRMQLDHGLNLVWKVRR